MPGYIPADAYSWESQSVQYAWRDQPGIHLERHALGVLGQMTEIDCLLARDEQGLLIGILNRYCDDSNPLEKTNNVNVWVKPDHQRQGIATALLTEAKKRWPALDAEAQNYTPQGLQLLDGLIHKGLVT